MKENSTTAIQQNLHVVQGQQTTTFQDLNLKEKLLRGIYGYGFQSPSLIQQKAILPIIQRKNLIAQAQAGTGKTGAFAIGLLERIDQSSPYCQALVLSPTRQLASQNSKIIKLLGEFTSVKSYCSIGGISVKEDRAIIKREINHIITGTPGRLLDHLQKKVLSFEHLKVIVIDEADEMLSRGFVPQIQQIFAHIPSDTQICLFSATYPKDVLQITNNFMSDCVKILIEAKEVILEGVKQFYLSLSSYDQKFPTMVQLYKNIPVQQSIVFTNKKQKVIQIENEMKKLGFPVSCIHSDVQDRSKALSDFKSGKSRILISTDLVGRGIDIQQVNLVINFDLPPTSKDALSQYVHRIGRCGRYGRKGVAINLISEGDADLMVKIQNNYSMTMDQLPLDLSKIAFH